MKSIGRPFVDKGKLRNFFKQPLQKDLGIAQPEQKLLKILTEMVTVHCQLKDTYLNLGW
jgi:hypothetical protein